MNDKAPGARETVSLRSDPAEAAAESRASGVPETPTAKRRAARAGPSISLVMPAYNEERTVERAVERCLAVLESSVDDYEVVLLDDGSRDRTAAVMAELQARDPDRIRLIVHERNQGIAASYEELYRAATKDFVMLIPADDQYPPEALSEILPLLDEHDIVVCRRTRKPYTPWRHCISISYTWLPRLLFGVRLYDPGSTKCVRRQIFVETSVSSRGVFVEAERLIRAIKRGHRIAAVDVVQGDRQAGTATGAHPRTVAVALADLVRLWWSLVVLRRTS